MRQLPSLARDGILTKSFWDQVRGVIHDNFKEAQIQPGVGYQVTRSTGGSSLLIKPSIGGSTAARLPFDLIPSSDTQGNPAITIWPGLVNGILAGNILDTFSVDKGSLWYAKAGCTTDGTQVTSITMYVDTSPPDIQTPATDAMPGEVDVLVGLYKDGMTYNVRGGNATITPSKVSDAAGHYSGVWA